MKVTCIKIFLKSWGAAPFAHFHPNFTQNGHRHGRALSFFGFSEQGIDGNLVVMQSKLKKVR